MLFRNDSHPLACSGTMWQSRILEALRIHSPQVDHQAAFETLRGALPELVHLRAANYQTVSFRDSRG